MTTSNLLDTIIAQVKLSKKETAKQQKIVETAIAMFAEKGYANTSTSEIAKKSGVAEATIFRHYGTKENLLLSVILPFLKNSLPMVAHEFVEQLAPSGFERFEDLLRALIRNRLEFLKANKDLFQIFVKELLYREDFRNELLSLFGREVFQHFHQALERFKANGELVDIPTPTLIRMILSFIISQFAIRFVVMREDFITDDEAEVELMVRFVMSGVSNKASSS
ncbi:TetR/AcrR family transcriptional regulator [Paenibacillus sp. HJGM_3]|uniref:TetR/AcrR family transcriptional regulator n=1 Tax=Paenibacillus sp. HJGM_3 TaxID=3379816 RepID=UPI003858A49F